MSQDPLIGQQLGNFRVDQLLSRGGVARTYSGWDIKLERPIAIKVVDVRQQDRPDYAERFLRVACAIATWRHENIVQIYYADEQDERCYYVMEYVDGLNLCELLTQYVDENELMPHRDVLRLGRAIAEALDYAHERDIIHHDVKPSHVIVAHDGRVVLTDFGPAWDVKRGAMGQTSSSPYYTAPEQARNPADAVPQSDLYALSVILYEMLTGRVPFDDPSPTAVAVQHITEPPPSPRQINPDLGPEVETVLLKALDKSPGERYQTGRELLDALERALEAVPAVVLPTELPPLPVTNELLTGLSLSLMSVDDKVASYLQEKVPPPECGDSIRPGDDLLNQQLDEYRLESLLGEGGMARVYLGLDVRLNRHVAIKVIDTPFRADADYLQRFEREAQAIARLEHPHIIRLYRYGEARGLLYMAMQYVDGVTLSERLAGHREAQTFMEPEQAVRIIHQVCEALDYAHRHDIIHRDVKPANIMLNKEGQVILTDFGLALLTEAGTRGMVLGSPHYIAPEQAISSAGAVPQSDLYAVGVILYEMFTGQRPFDAETPLDIAMQHVTGSPLPPRVLHPDISPALEAVILKAMARRPADRYGSGKELTDALDRALTKTSLPAPTPVPPFPEPRFDPDASTVPPPGHAAKAPRPQAARPRAALLDRRVLLYGGIGLALCILLAVVLFAAAPLVSRVFQATGQTPTITVEAAGTATRSSLVKGTPTTTARPTISPTTEPPATTPPAPSPSAQPPATPSPPPGAALPTDYHLRIYKRDKDSLFVVNQGSEAFPLALLRLGNDKGLVDGAAWGVEMLESGACVAVWADKENPKPPEGVSCDPIGARLVAEGKDPFWKHDCDVYYGEEKLGTCKAKPKQCSIRSGEEGNEDND